jgi:DNA-binding GntR family transcriptional regulator
VSPNTPKHVDISEKLRSEIEAGIYEPGEKLPSEFDLGQRFGVSRTTIRRAIADLTRQGLVTTYQGKGCFVAQHEKINFSLASPLIYFDAELKRQNLDGTIESRGFKCIDAPKDVARRLQLPEDDRRVYWQEKVIYVGDESIALDITYYCKPLGDLLGDQLQTGFTYYTLARNGFKPYSAEVRVECALANFQLSECLSVPLGLPLFVYNYVATDQDGIPFVCGKTLTRSDRTCFSVKIAEGSVE